MPSLITRTEALELAALSDQTDIEALVERAWSARIARFGDATDMCSFANVSGGCSHGCACAPATPMDPLLILEHAQAAEAAGAHRFCMVTEGGPTISNQDFAKVVAGARLVARHTSLKRCASVGSLSVGRAKELRAAGVQRVHHDVELGGHDETIGAVRDAGLETCAGGTLDLARPATERVAVAFDLAAIDPTSVAISLDADLPDPWEAVKWIAIVRLIVPGALLRLTGDRAAHLGELQPLAVKAGLNGVMMGNALTELGTSPEEDQAMFEDLGLNVARQPDNGSRPRPDNRSGWMQGATPISVLEAA